MLSLHYLHYVSQRGAEEAMQQIDGLSFVKRLQVLDHPSSWTLEITTQGTLYPPLQRLLTVYLHPTTPIWNQPQLPPIATTL
jgi:hypothetical protein